MLRELWNKAEEGLRQILENVTVPVFLNLPKILLSVKLLFRGSGMPKPICFKPKGFGFRHIADSEIPIPKLMPKF